MGSLKEGETSILLEKLWEDDDKAVELAVQYFQTKTYLWSSLGTKK